MENHNNLKKDIEAVLSHRYDHGGDFWTTPDYRVFKGAPFSLYDATLLLLELGLEPNHHIISSVSKILWGIWREDGRFNVAPKGTIYPCNTTAIAMLLSKMGFANDLRLQTTYQHLLDIQYHDGGWRCNKFMFGRGEETQYSNPLPTLLALDAFRFTEQINQNQQLDRAVDFLLNHWIIKKPIGPCHYGIGSLFKQIEYPFRGYNIFYYVYVLSFYQSAQKDERFIDALSLLQSKIVDSQIVIERVVPKLAKLNFCKKGQPSLLATKRYQEIIDRLTS